MSAERALEKRSSSLLHVVSGEPLDGPYPEGSEIAYFGLGCFWGAERLFWTQPGVVVTAVGYSGGTTRNPTYAEVCSGRTGHVEIVKVVYDPRQISYGRLLKLFFESHDPTQGLRQGNDIGSQYRSAIFVTSPAQAQEAKQAREAYDRSLVSAGYPHVTTEIADAAPFSLAEDYHQQYLAKNPGGYCGLRGTGIACSLA